MTPAETTEPCGCVVWRTGNYTLTKLCTDHRFEAFGERKMHTPSIQPKPVNNEDLL